MPAVLPFTPPRPAFAGFLDALAGVLGAAGIRSATLPVASGDAPGDAAGDPPLRLLVGTVVDYIDARPDRVADLQTLADRTGHSVYHFARIFREETGMTPWAYVQAARLREARRLLETTDRSLADIALAAGFYDQSHFTRVFRAAEGLPPGAYRARHRKQHDETAAAPRKIVQDPDARAA